MNLNRCLLNSIFAVLFLFLTGCSAALEKNIVIFIGDSLVAGWDVEYYFPYLDISNLGVYGAKVNEIKINAFPDDISKSTVVSLIGTNDIGTYNGNELPVNKLRSRTVCCNISITTK